MQKKKQRIFRNLLAKIIMQFLMGASEQASLMAKFKLWAA
jgi:hypothetical protein